MLHGRAEEKLRALRERLGEKACNLVQLNSREAGGKGSPYEGLFRSHMQLVVPGGGGGEPASHATPPSQVTPWHCAGARLKQNGRAQYTGESGSLDGNDGDGCTIRSMRWVPVSVCVRERTVPWSENGATKKQGRTVKASCSICSCFSLQANLKEPLAFMATRRTPSTRGRGSMLE